MNKNEFLSQLEKLLSDLPEEEPTALCKVRKTCLKKGETQLKAGVFSILS